MPALVENNPIDSNGSYTTKITPGQFYSFGAAGDFSGGSLAVYWVNEGGEKAAFPDSPLTASRGFVLVSPTGLLELTLTGAGAPNLYIHLVPIA